MFFLLMERKWDTVFISICTYKMIPMHFFLSGNVVKSDICCDLRNVLYSAEITLVIGQIDLGQAIV